MEAKKETSVPSGLLLIGKLAVNLILFVVYAVLFQFLVGFVLGVAEGIGILADGTVTGDDASDVIFQILGIVSLIVALLLFLPKEIKFYFSIKNK